MEIAVLGTGPTGDGMAQESAMASNVVWCRHVDEAIVESGLADVESFVDSDTVIDTSGERGN